MVLHFNWCGHAQDLMTYIPSVVEATANGTSAMDIHSRLLKDRIIMMSGEITDEISNIIISQLLYLETTNPEKPAKLYINSPGGSVTAGMAIYDVMQHITVPVHTIVMGIAASMATVVMQAAAPGYRNMLPNARLMIHQPLGSVSGSVSDAEITYKEMLYYKNMIAELYAKHNTLSHDSDYFLTLMDRDSYFSAADSVELGVADHIMLQQPLYGVRNFG